MTGLVGRSAAIRLAVGLGDAERELALLTALGDAEDLQVTDRCLSGDELRASLEGHRADVALVAADLHRLGAEALEELARARVPLVLLAPDAGAGRWHAFPGPVLPLDAAADAGLLRRAIEAALRGERFVAATQTAANGHADDLPQLVPAPARGGTPGVGAIAAAAALPATVSAGLGVCALAGGHGSPGRTTLAVGLATALGAVASTILVDADLSGGASVAAHLDADPTRNLYMVAHAEPETPRDWERALAQETQPLHAARSPHGMVLCGVPKPEMRGAIDRAFLERLLAELRQRYRYVVIDLGTDLVGADPAATAHRAALMLADQALLVAATDVVGLSHARAALATLRGRLGLDGERVTLLLNRHDRRYHHDPVEVEWALGAPLAAVVPNDHHAVQRALGAQQPLVLEGGRGGAPRALLDLAERLHGGSIRVPPPAETDGAGGPGWLRALRRRVPGAGVARPRPAGGEPSDDAHERGRLGAPGEATSA